jgi:hypothetical protein
MFHNEGGNSLMATPSKDATPWGWIVVVVFVGILGFNCLRTSWNREVDGQIQQFLNQEYGPAVRQYRADPMAFRARVQQQVQRGELSPQDAEDLLKMVERLSRKLP